MTCAGKHRYGLAIAGSIALMAWLIAGSETVVIERRLSLLSQLD